MSFPLPPENRPLSAAILAGGTGSRMGGASKAFLDVGGRAILDRQIDVLRPRFAEILVATAPAADPDPFAARGVRIATDAYPGSGPLAGLHAALGACRTPWLFAVACDMPFLDGALIDRMTLLSAAIPEVDALVPRLDGRAEPLHALYRSAIAGAAERCLRERRLAMSDLLGDVRARYLEEADLPWLTLTRSLRNLNTPGDLDAASGRE